MAEVRPYTEQTRLDAIIAAFIYCGDALDVEQIRQQYWYETGKHTSVTEVSAAVGRSK